MFSAVQIRQVAVWVMALIGWVAVDSAQAASMTVLPVTIHMQPGQMVTSLTIINPGQHQMAFQVRAFQWTQQHDHSQLQPTSMLMASPPLGTIDPDARQVIRMALRVPPQQKEASYRILVSQIPPPSAPGIVRIVLQMSIPIFAEPDVRVAPRVQWSIERRGNAFFLAAVNGGTCHETIRSLELTTPDGHVLKVDTNASPYILAGATRRWRISSAADLALGTDLHLTASTSDGRVDQSIHVTRSS